MCLNMTDEQIVVKLSHRNKGTTLKFPTDATVADVRKKACAWTTLPSDQFKILLRGREQGDEVTLQSLTKKSNALRLMVVEKPPTLSYLEPEPEASTAAATHDANEAVDACCAGLGSCWIKVEELEALPELNEQHRKKLLGVNEELERMLLKLDAVTGLQGPEREYKKSRVNEIQALCSRLDTVRRKGPV